MNLLITAALQRRKTFARWTEHPDHRSALDGTGMVRQARVIGPSLNSFRWNRSRARLPSPERQQLRQLGQKRPVHRQPLALGHRWRNGDLANDGLERLALGRHRAGLVPVPAILSENGVRLCSTVQDKFRLFEGHFPVAEGCSVSSIRSACLRS